MATRRGSSLIIFVPEWLELTSLYLFQPRFILSADGSRRSLEITTSMDQKAFASIPASKRLPAAGHRASRKAPSTRFRRCDDATCLTAYEEGTFKVSIGFRQCRPV